MPILWRPAMALDNGILDHDHQFLLSIVNEFYDAVPRAGSKADMERTLAKLHHYINVHMGREEHLQAQVNFPVRADHHKEHRVLVSRLDSVTEKVARLDFSILQDLPSLGGDSDLVVMEGKAYRDFLKTFEEIRILLREWLINHIIKSDLPMKPYIDGMRPHALRMPSIWNAQPALLAPNLDTCDAAKSALRAGRSWMSAGFRDESGKAKPASEMLLDSTDQPLEHPLLTRMRAAAKRMALQIDFDMDCSNIQDEMLQGAMQAWSDIAQGGSNESRSTSQYVLEAFRASSALFSRAGDGHGGHRYFVRKAGGKFQTVFGKMDGQMLDEAMPGIVTARWTLLLDGVLELGQPLHVFGRTNAFGRTDLMVEGLLAPFIDRQNGTAEVLAVASYEQGVAWSGAGQQPSANSAFG